MAYCTNCGAANPDGARFCNSCGGKLEKSKPYTQQNQTQYASRQAYSGDMAEAVPHASGTGKGVLIGALAAVLVVGLVIGILFLTGVLGSGSGNRASDSSASPALVVSTPAPTPSVVGTWTLSDAGNNRNFSEGESAILVLEEGGTGYAIEIEAWGDEKETEYYPLSWNDSTIAIEEDLSDGFSYSWSGDTLTIYDDYSLDDYSLTFTRSNPDTYFNAPGASAGTYQLTGIFAGDEDYSSIIATELPDGLLLTLYAGGTGTISIGEETEQLTWDRHFVTVGYDAMFYAVENGQLVLMDDGERMIFTRIG